MLADYSLSDLLMFGPEVFLRLHLRLNQDLWPWQWLALVMMVAVAALLGHRHPSRHRIILLILGASWVWSGAGFLLGYYAPINWPVGYLGWGFVAQGLGLGAVALVWSGNSSPVVTGPARWWLASGWLGLMLALPWLAVLESGNWQSLALFATTADITVLGFVLCSLLLPRGIRWPLLLLPLAWSLFSAATLWALGTHLLFAVPAATVVLTVCAFLANPRPAKNRYRQSAHHGPAG